ncbi:hypothetical protein L3X38_016536 [Prunus dulcis]|uniref:Uncharacterized protein n=1 Tax=Prunus dulcis TaxID=3755 RepID=A0AAD4Z8B9_PRUDU|nr:hypothetical protein L3X38_016536 [Prunus dulcis]
MLPSDVTMSTDIQFAFSFVSVLEIYLTSLGDAQTVGASNANQVDYDPLNPASLRIRFASILTVTSSVFKLEFGQFSASVFGHFRSVFGVGPRTKVVPNMALGYQLTRMRDLQEVQPARTTKQSVVGGPSGAVPAVPTMQVDPNFQQTLELLTQVLASTG